MEKVEIKPFNCRFTVDFSGGLSREIRIDKLVYAVSAEPASEKYLTDVAIIRIIEIAKYCYTPAKLEEIFSSGDQPINGNVIWLKPLTEWKLVPIESPEPKPFTREQIIEACESPKLGEEDFKI